MIDSAYQSPAALRHHIVFAAAQHPAIIRSSTPLVSNSRLETSGKFGVDSVHLAILAELATIADQSGEAIA